MDVTQSWQALAEEDRLVAELHQLGLSYLSNRAVEPAQQPRLPEQMLADIVCQPGSRVRTAVIALFLLHPAYADALPAALALLSAPQQQLLKLFYTAAVYLQRQYYNQLLPIVTSGWQWLPDQFGLELGVPLGLSAKEAIRQLGIRHRALSLLQANWAGTYENVVHHLIRYKQREAQWNQLPPIS